MIRIFTTAFAALAGLAFGSFLNVCVTRWPAGESVVTPRSHCRSCVRTLAWWENIPLASWLFLRGRCRTCGASISWRYPLVEFGIACLWSAVAARPYPDFPSDDFLVLLLLHEFGLRLLTMAFLWALVALAVLDAENLWLPNFLTLTGMVIGFLIAAVDPFILLALTTRTGIPFTEKFEHSRFGLWTPALGSLGSILVAASLVLFIRWTYWLIRRREGIGLGDAKLMAMLGAWLGLPGALLSFVIGVLLATIAAFVLLALPASRRGSESWIAAKLPLGTFLCLGGIVSALWGQAIIAAYLRLVGIQI